MSIIEKKRDLTGDEQGQLASIIKGAGYIGLLETIVDFLQADSNGANEDYQPADDDEVGQLETLAGGIQAAIEEVEEAPTVGNVKATDLLEAMSEIAGRRK